MNYKYWYSNQLIWWSNDVADKPSQNFFNEIVWNDFNGVINFSSVLNSSLTVNKKLDIKYIKVLDQELQKYKYFFISNIKAEMTGTFVYELELDVWATYILPKYLTTKASFDRLSFLNNIDDSLKIRQNIGFNELDFSYYNLKPTTLYYSQNLGANPNGDKWLINDNYVYDLFPDGLELWKCRLDVKCFEKSTGISVKKRLMYKLQQDDSGAFSQIYFIEIDANNKAYINIYPVNFDEQNELIPTHRYTNITIDDVVYKCNNQYYNLMLRMSEPESINRFGGVYIGPPFIQLISSMSENNNIVDIGVVSSTKYGENFYIKTFFYSANEMQIFQYTSPNTQIFKKMKILDSVNSLETYYTYPLIYNKIIDFSKTAFFGFLGIGSTLKFNCDVTNKGFYIFSKNQDGAYGFSKEVWLEPYQLPSLTDNYNQYISGVMSSTNNGIRQVNQQRDFNINQSHFNESSNFFGNIMGGIKNGLTGNWGGLASNITSQFDNTRNSQAQRKQINMNADNQLKAIKSSFDDKSRTLQPSINISNIDTLIQAGSIGLSDMFFEFPAMIYDVSIENLDNLLSYVLYHYYNGFICDITTDFTNIVNKSGGNPEYKNMYCFKIASINLNEYININYNYSIYEKSLIADILSGVVRVWDVEPTINDLENKLKEFQNEKLK